MATTKTKRAKNEPRYPERKWGPFAGGSGVAVWLNEFQTEQGTRYARSNVVKAVMWRRSSEQPI